MSYKKIKVAFDNIEFVKVSGEGRFQRWSYRESNGLEHTWTGKTGKRNLYRALGERGVSVQDRERVFAWLEATS